MGCDSSLTIRVCCEFAALFSEKRRWPSVSNLLYAVGLELKHARRVSCQTLVFQSGHCVSAHAVPRLSFMLTAVVRCQSIAPLSWSWVTFVEGVASRARPMRRCLLTKKLFINGAFDALQESKVESFNQKAESSLLTRKGKIRKTFLFLRTLKGQKNSPQPNNCCNS